MSASMPLVAEEAVALEQAQPPSRGRVRGVGRLRPFLTVYWALLALLVLVALLAPVIAPYNPVRANLSAITQPPSWHHLFGTDTNGMDVFSRTLWATRTDLSVAILGVLMGMVVGVPLGAVSGYVGGVRGESLSRLSEVVQSIPLFLFALIVFAALGNSRAVLVGIVAFVNAPQFLKLTRSVVLPLVGMDFIAAARGAGLKPWQIIVRHVMPNALGPVAGQLSLSCAYAIQIIAAVAFLGLGVAVPKPEWGSMIQDGAGPMVQGQWWMSVFPGIAILISVIAFGGIGRQLSRWYAR
jgi:peptide/nickel transport system permease protein